MNAINESLYSFKQIMEKVHALPPFNPAINRILKVIANPLSSATDVAHALQLDPAITTAVLRLANSAFIGMPRSISSVANAVAILGYNRIQSLVLVSGIIQSRPSLSDTPFTLYRFWRHSLCCGMLAESIAMHCKRHETIDTSDAFCAGLLHDIGKLFAALCAPHYVEEVYERAKIEKCPFYVAESGDGAHAQVGEAVCEQWQFPQMLSTALAYHHSPMTATTHKQMCAVIHCADALSHLIGMSTLPDEYAPNMDINALESLSISVEQLRALASQQMYNQKVLESVLQVVP